MLGALALASCSSTSSTTPTPTPTPDPVKIACPAPVSAQSALGQPTVVQFPAATTTNGAPPISVSCTPASGSLFSLGSTSVTCTATDALHRTDACTFVVSVAAPPILRLTSFIAFGDSMTAGEIVSEGSLPFRALRIDSAKSYPTNLFSDLLGYYTAQSQTIAVYTEGVTGETTTLGLSRLPGVLRTFPAQVVLIMEGANDLGGGASAVSLAVGNMRAMVDTAKAYGYQVLLASIPPENPFATCFPNRGEAWAFVAPYNAGVQAVARSEGVPFVDVYQAFGGTATADLIDCDGLHPTAAGYKLIADTFFQAIKQALTQTTTAVPIGIRSHTTAPRR
jgi:lysophospholipase L1-like esterase